MKKRILIVEDDMIAFVIGKRIFEAASCEVEHAARGEDAVELLSKNTYDAIYMDLGLPNMTGLEACKAIHTYEAKHKKSITPIIAVTANDNPAIIHECLAVGMIDVLFKPLNDEKVAKFLAACGL